VRAGAGQSFVPNLGMIMPKMGTVKAPTRTRTRTTGLGSALFTGTQQRVLAILFGQPERSFYANELIGLAGAGSGATQRELARLAGTGLLTVRAIGSQKHYQANAASPIFAELHSIVQKTFGLAEPLRAALDRLRKHIVAAFVYGSVAKQTDTAASDIDLLVISDDLAYADLYAALEKASSVIGRTINPTILMRKDLAKKIKAKESFITRVLAQPKIWIVADDHALAV
jgi:predicted nucleotidyltransferase